MKKKTEKMIINAIEEFLQQRYKRKSREKKYHK